MSQARRRNPEQTGSARGNEQVRAEALLEGVRNELEDHPLIPPIGRDAWRDMTRVYIEQLAVLMELWPYDTMTMLRRHRA